MAKAVLMHQSIWQSRILTQIRERAHAAHEAGDAEAICFGQQTILLLNYLITNPGGNAIGLFGFDANAAGEALLLAPWELDKHFSVLADLDFLTYDKRLYEVGYFRKLPFVWLHSMAKYQFELLDPRKNMSPADRRVSGIRNMLEASPCKALVDLFLTRYNTRCSLNYDPATLKTEVAVREENGDNLIGPSLEVIRSQGVRW